MITEDYVGYEVAKLLKEKGFPFMCNVGSLWVDKQGKTKFHNSFAPITWVNEDDPDTPCVTQALAMKWLREEHKLSIEIMRNYDYSTDADNKLVNEWWNWSYRIISVETASIVYIPNFYEDGFDTYEDTAEAAIKYVLEILI